MPVQKGMITVRRAAAGDVPVILGFIQSLAEYEKLSHAVVATEADLQENLFGEKPAAEVLIGLLDDEPVGYALYFTTFSTFIGKPGIWLEDLFVLPKFRGQGVGKRLLKELAAIAVKRNCGRLEWSVLDWNEPAIGFYKKVGAVFLDDWTICRLMDEALQNAGK